MITPYQTSADLLELVHPDDRTVFLDAVNRTKDHGEPFCCEYRVLMLDGSYHWILGKGRRVLKKPGGIRIIGVSQDFTARKQTELELARRTRQLMELTSQLVISEQRERRRLAEVLHGQLQQILVGARVWLDLMDIKPVQRTGKPMAKVRQNLQDALEVCRGLTRDLVPPTLPHEEFLSTFHWISEDTSPRV